MRAADRPPAPRTARDVLRLAILGRRGALVLASLLLALHQAAEAAVPVLIGVVVDRAIEPSSGRALVLWLAALAAVFVTLSLAFRFGSRVSQRVALLAEHELRLRLLRRVLERTRRNDLLPGAVLNLATSDAARVAFFDVSLAGTAAALAAFAVAASVLLTTSLVLGLVVLVGLPPLLLGLHLVAGPLERRSSTEQAAAAHAAGMATDLVTGLRVLKGLGAEQAAASRYRAASAASLRATLRAAGAQAAYDGATVGAVGCFLALVALVGGRLAAEGRISVGELVAALGLTQFLIGPIGRLGAASGSFRQARASARRIAAVLDPPSGRDASSGVAVREGSLHVARDGWRLTVAPGELVGLAADPEGANELIDLLARADDDRLLVAPHDADLFGGSLLDNVRAGAGEPDKVEAALAAAAADEVASALPHGAASEVGERGRLLSGGQRQRVALARALAAAPAVLVLHDPTTAVDPVTEAQIAAGIRRVRGDAATLVVATSPTLLAACDRVVHLTAGGAPAEATHRQLLERDGRYRELVLA